MPGSSVTGLGLSVAEANAAALPNWAVKGIGDLGTLGSVAAEESESFPVPIKELVNAPGALGLLSSPLAGKNLSSRSEFALFDTYPSANCSLREDTDMRR